MSKLRGLLLVLVVAAAVGAGPGAGVVVGDPAGQPHRPDLRTLRPTGLEVQVTKSSKRLLRFTNTVANHGKGRLEIRPENDPETKATIGFQSVYTHDDGKWVVVREFRVGTFEFHPPHDHWHLEGFARYELLNRKGKVVRSSRKVSFCLVDSTLVAPSLPHSPSQAFYTSCSQDEVQGISVGWGDAYDRSLPGQSLDITGLPNGRYRLRSTADPFKRIRETNETNNASAVRFRLRDRQIILLEG